MDTTQTQSHQTAEQVSGDFGQYDALQTRSINASAPPPDQRGMAYQLAANSSHQVHQLMQFKAVPSSSQAPIQRALPGEISDARQVHSAADQAAHARYTARKDATQDLINNTPTRGAASSVAAKVFSGNFGLLGDVPIPNTGGGDPRTDHARDRASGQQARYPSRDGEMYLIDAFDGIVKDYIQTNKNRLRPLNWHRRSRRYVANNDPLNDEIRIEIVGPKGTCTDCQAALRSWLRKKQADFQHAVRYPYNLDENNVDWQNLGQAGSVQVSLVTRWTDGRQVLDNVRMGTRSQSHTYGSPDANEKTATLKGSGTAKNKDHYKLAFNPVSTTPPSLPQKPKKQRAGGGNAFELLSQLDSGHESDTSDQEDLIDEKSSLVASSSQSQSHSQPRRRKKKSKAKTPQTGARDASTTRTTQGPSGWKICPFCYLTTACVTHHGLPDDCEELTLLRAFRDEYLYNQPNGPALIKKYYTYAPNIVQCINDRSDRKAVYGEIYQVIRECVELLKAGNNEETFLLYCKMVEEVKEKYAGAVLVL